MGQGDDSYIAWDGQRYEGRPPGGWFLAADNRWWPTPDLIDQADNATSAEPSSQSPTHAQPLDPPAPAAPLPAAEPVQEPQTGRQPRQQRSSRVGRKAVSRIGQVLFFIFVFRGCIGVQDFDFDNGAEVASPDLAFELAEPETYELTIDPCTGSLPTGQIRNGASTTVRFRVILNVRFDGGLAERWSSAPTLPANPGALVNWRAPMPEGTPPIIGCTVAHVESQQAE